MNFFSRIIALVIIAFFLASCGGSNSSSTQMSGSTIIFSGVAAAAAPMSGAIVVMEDATGMKVCEVLAQADGTYTCSVSATAKSPLVASASKHDIKYYAPVAELKSGTVNLTKLTHVIAAQLSPTGDPSSLGSQIRAGTARVTPEEVSRIVHDLRVALRPLLVNADGDIDPISGKFSADGTKHNRVLMALDVIVTPTPTKADITLTVLTKTGDGEQPTAIAFRSGESVPMLPQAVQTAALPDTDEDRLIKAFVDQLNRCYALPLNERVSGSSVLAPDCRRLFSNADPSTYKYDGYLVSPTGHFPGLFSDSATGMINTPDGIDFRYKQDSRLRLVLKFFSPKTGIDGYSRLIVKREGNNFVAVGNQYNYPFEVRAWTETREIVHHPELSYWSTGFNLHVPKLVRNGQSIFEKVVVTPPQTSPVKREFVLKPLAGLDYLPLQGLQTNNARIAGRFKDSARTDFPRKLATQELLLWLPDSTGNDADWTETDIKDILNVGRWKAEFYLVGNSRPVTQYFETGRAPLTVPQLTVAKWAALKPETLNIFKNESSPQGPTPNRVPLGGRTNYLLKWDVADGALAPTEASLWIRGIPGEPFEDSLRVASGVKEASVPCTNTDAGDKHCVSTSGTARFADGVGLTGLRLYVLDRSNMLWATQYWSYKLLDN